MSSYGKQFISTLFIEIKFKLKLVMIKTKSILNKKDKLDGTRICVMRYVRYYYDYDEWIKDLAPSSKLLNDYKNKKIDWFDYKKRYLDEMSKYKDLIGKLKKRIDKGEKITLLCFEKKSLFCHRRILKNLIENF